MEEFTIKNLEGYTFRYKKITAIEVNAFANALNLNDITKAIYLHKQIFERIEVKIKDTWLNVKEPGKEVYWPANLLDLPKAVSELFDKFVEDIIFKAFL